MQVDQIDDRSSSSLSVPASGIHIIMIALVHMMQSNTITFPSAVMRLRLARILRYSGPIEELLSVLLKELLRISISRLGLQKGTSPLWTLRLWWFDSSYLLSARQETLAPLPTWYTVSRTSEKIYHLTLLNTFVYPGKRLVFDSDLMDNT